MSSTLYRRGTAGVRLLLEHGAAAGLDSAALLKGSGLDAGTLQDPEGEIAPEQELRVARNLARALGQPPGLGLALGLRFRLANFGLWGYGLMSSPTMGEALQTALRYLPLTFAFSTITQRVHGDELVVEFGAPAQPAGLRRLLVERDIAAAAALVQQVAGAGFRLRRVELATGRAPAVGLREIAGVEPRLGAARDALVFDRRDLDRPLPQADAVTAALCDRLCRELLQRRRVGSATAARLQHHLAGVPAGQLPRLGALAERLHTSERTLKRRLRAEGTSFRALSAAQRSRAAAELLADPALSISEIADQLGYADLSSFSQAFKRWYGVSPAAYRRAA